jgi:hypothetical protein
MDTTTKAHFAFKNAERGWSVINYGVSRSGERVVLAYKPNEIQKTVCWFVDGEGNAYSGTYSFDWTNDAEVCFNRRIGLRT